MTLRKIIIDKNGRYIPSIDSSPIENSHDHKPNPRRKSKNISQSNEMFTKNIAAERIKLLKRIMICIF